MNPLTSFFRLFDFRKFKVVDVIKAENEEEANKIFRKKLGKDFDEDRI
jgi:hypothetical protein